MGMTVTLYQGCKVNGSSRMGLWANLIDQKNYFDSLSRNVISTGTVKLGEPLRLNLSVNDLLTYDYGNIDYGDGFRYYFTISNIEMVTETISDVYYIIDAYETLVMQKPFAYGRAYITRYPSRIGKPMLTYEPNIIVNQEKDILVNEYNLIAVGWVSADNHYITIIIPTNNTAQISWNDWFDGGWFAKVKNQFPLVMRDVTANDIIITSVVPGHLVSNPSDTMIYNNIVTSIAVSRDSVLGSATISSDETIDIIRDCRGNIVYTCPIGHSYDIGTEIKVLVSVSNISLMCELTTDNVVIEYVRIPCENVSWVVDSWQEYAIRQRAIDIETRNTQNEKSLVSGVINASESAVMGSLFGGGGKGGLTSMQGAVAGAGGGLVSALGNYALNMIYGEKEQALIDKSYQYANDMLVNMGDFTIAELMETKIGLYTVTFDNKVPNINDIAVNGYLVSFPVQYFSNYITLGKIQADVEILNISNQAWKEQIQNRFANGVMIV